MNVSYGLFWLQMADPLTALIYAVQVMNFLKSLILRTLREREDSVVEPTLSSRLEPFDENGYQSPSFNCIQDTEKIMKRKSWHLFWKNL